MMCQCEDPEYVFLTYLTGPPDAECRDCGGTIEVDEAVDDTLG